ncbi:MAG: hypothetical protein ACI9FW_000583 [Flavobacterium sp.]
MELPFRIKFSLSRKISGYEFPAISKWHNVVCNFKKNSVNQEKSMIKDYKFDKKRILLGVFISICMIMFSILFLLKPEVFIRNIFMQTELIQILGITGLAYFLAIFYSVIKLFPRKYAIQITDEFLLDNSKYESLGKIRWQNISKIERIKKKGIQIFVNESVFQNVKLNILEKFLLFMGNWNYKKSIIISSAFIDCNIEELYENIILAYKNQ